ncbi:toxin-antitoxin system, toxin component, Bro family protein [Bacillus cereus]|nr:toxin-antitoxin system, toxin component, Bro family protein [Bacillus cereus]
MNELQVFNNDELGQVRTVMKDGEHWFIAKDVCDVLELKQVGVAMMKLDEDEKDVCLTNTLGGDQKMSIINESGLYSLILKSRKPQGKAFKKWITSEVLPMIRKTGGYVNNDEMFVYTYLTCMGEKRLSLRAIKVSCSMILSGH